MGKSVNNNIKIGNIKINIKVLSAFIICSFLIFAGIVRILSYLRESFISQIIEDTFLYYFAYHPKSYFNVNFFKIFATPSIIAFIYFLFRGLNDKEDDMSRQKIINEWRKVNFNSGVFRFFIVLMISLCWIPIEVIKFHFKGSFYPFSTLEDPLVNLIVLAAGGILSYFLMKYLPFNQLITKLK
jgi:hypothetical protein